MQERWETESVFSHFSHCSSLRYLFTNTQARCPGIVVPFRLLINEQNGIESGEEVIQLHPEIVQQRKVLSCGQTEPTSRSYSGSGSWRNLKHLSSPTSHWSDPLGQGGCTLKPGFRNKHHLVLQVPQKARGFNNLKAINLSLSAPKLSIQLSFAQLARSTHLTQT